MQATWHPLACHMTDSAEAAGWLWDYFLSPGLRALLDASTGDGRSTLRWLADLHDLGKATPSFQIRSEPHADAVRAAGLPMDPRACEAAPSHGHLSGLLISDFLREAKWERDSVAWIALTLAGHHGVFPAANWRERRAHAWQLGDSSQDGDRTWSRAREELIALACTDARMPGLRSPGISAPDLPLQLAISGAVILADWLASNEDVFGYAGQIPDNYREVSAGRATSIGALTGLHHRWRPDQAVSEMSAATLYGARFGRVPRPVQEAAFAAVLGAGRGLLLIEAPMGEGKTEAALAAAEVLALAAGVDGLFVGLPTKATANQMYRRVGTWLKSQKGTHGIALAHSGARRHGPYRELLATGVGIDEHDGGLVASEWLTGPKKTLLASITVGTIDQLLLAGVSSRHVSLRHLGLSGKVVIIDEVHACDAYMSEILKRVLSWLGAARIPVILLSATLSAGQREELLTAYACRPTAGDRDGDAYPRLSWVPAPERVAPRRSRRDQSEPIRARVLLPPAARSSRVAVTMLDERDLAAVPVLATELTSGAGSALVVRNTVRRAQDTYRALCELNGEADVMLVHARYTAADRRRREDEVIALFGPEGRRPRRRIVVGTQVLEQSLDCDFDVLITDLAPIDLLFQRAGRIHRHDLPAALRGNLQQPQMFIAGRETGDALPPRIPPGSRIVYHDHLLWRTEAALMGLDALDVPGDVSRLVDQVYGADPVGPDSWQPAMATAMAEEAARHRELAGQAETIMLPPPTAVSLSAIHSRANVGDAIDEATPAVQAHVRIGAPTLEVMLLRRTHHTDVAVTVSGGVPQEIPLNREPDGATADIALDQLIRLPAQVTAAATTAASPRGSWAGSPWLARIPVLRLPADGEPLRLGRHLCTYTPEMGLEVINA
jgi:CRISPR-associated endonuclease/helicase Cas3